jgi:two-component system OmpR family sensor kinase
MDGDKEPFMDMSTRGNQERHLAVLQALLAAPSGGMQNALTHAADAIARAFDADKVDAFLYDETRDSLVAFGVSMQPLSNLQRSLGLDVLPLSNGGRVVHVYKTGEVFHTGNLLGDPDELRGVKEGLRIQSKVGAPLEIGGRRRGMIMVASLAADFFTEEDAAFVQSAAHWVSLVAHRAELMEQIERNAMEYGRKQVAEELVTVVAHDLRNYLSPVSLRLYNLKHRAQAEDRGEDVNDANVALGAISQLTSLLANLLDLARLDEGVFEMHLEPVDAVALLSEAARLLSTNEQQIVVKAAAQSIIVAADPVRIRQCVDNLLANAIKYSPPNATVSVFIAREDKHDQSWGRIEIVDEGSGLPEQVLPHVFERFRTGRGDGSGFGLGLYIAQRIATAHHGEVIADRYPGKGARFTVRLPVLS